MSATAKGVSRISPHTQDHSAVPAAAAIKPPRNNPAKGSRGNPQNNAGRLIAL
jgi:hypothetical protein